MLRERNKDIIIRDENHSLWGNQGSRPLKRAGSACKSIQQALEDLGMHCLLWWCPQATRSFRQLTSGRRAPAPKRLFLKISLQKKTPRTALIFLPL